MAEIDGIRKKCTEICVYFSVNFHPIRTKFCPRTAPTMLSNVVVHVRTAPGTLEKVIGPQSSKVAFFMSIGNFCCIFDQLFEKIRKNASRK